MKRLLAALAFVLASCTTTGGMTPAQAVFNTKTAYEVALTAAVGYRNLPACPVSKPPCHDPAILSQIQKAQPAVRATLDAAESAVRSNLTAEVVQKAVAAAEASLSAFTAITATLPKGN